MVKVGGNDSNKNGKSVGVSIVRCIHICRCSCGDQVSWNGLSSQRYDSRLDNSIDVEMSPFFSDFKKVLIWEEAFIFGEVQ